MNEQTKQLIEYLNTNSLFTKVLDNYKFVFEYAFVIQLFSESRKCRMNEGEKKLMLNTALTLVEENYKDFIQYLNENKRRVYFQWRQNDCENIAQELVEYIKDDQNFKRIINKWLYNYRDEIFKEKYYKTDFKIFVAVEHPMQTFVYWLDYIDNLKNSADDQNCFNVKRHLTNLLRVGNATIRRSEWTDTVEKVQLPPLDRQYNYS